MIKMRQKEGIAIAKARGVYSKERSKKLSLSQQKELKQDIENKVRVCVILKKYGITKPTYYRYKENMKA
jgi:DNA invertase Pin-like site-specific DNA recombinase